MKHIHHLHIYHTTAVQCGGDFTLFSGFALEAQKKELEIRITEEKLAKPKLSPDFVRFWLTRFRKLNPEIKSHRETLVNTFVNAIYLYDDKVLLTFNYKEGTKTISLDDVAALAASGESGSDLGCLAPPDKRQTNSCVCH